MAGPAAVRLCANATETDGGGCEIYRWIPSLPAARSLMYLMSGAESAMVDISSLLLIAIVPEGRWAVCGRQRASWCLIQLGANERSPFLVGILRRSLPWSVSHH